jgi:predicted dehydrogenase
VTVIGTAATGRLRFGLLGTARIAPAGLIEPARRLDVDVVAVAARDPERARAFAEEHEIDSVSRSYAELLERDGLDAV